MIKLFNLVSEFSPAGDQPEAIKSLCDGLKQNLRNQVLLGVTGSGKTFTMAHVIANSNRPALIMAHNKTLAAQLYSEMKTFFPDNAVEYFVSYYDYYQPEAYIANRDVYIEKDAQINEQIDLLRHSATRALLSRQDVIVVASVSCIYGLGAPELYLQMSFKVDKTQKINRNDLMQQLVTIQYKRNDLAFSRGTFRVRGDNVDIFPSHYEDAAWRVTLFGDDVEKITEFDVLTGEKLQELDEITIFANSHYVTPRPTIEKAITLIRDEMRDRVEWFRMHDKLLEAQRIEERTRFDLEMLMEAGSCKGIENYSRYLSGRGPGMPPPTLFEYLPDNALLFIDESHVTVPQVGGMYNGDRARKTTLVEYGFRLPSALDNRPLQYSEWDQMRPQTIFVSATPGKTELALTEGKYVEQIIRPTGLIDPICIIRPVDNQVDDLLNECKQAKDKEQRVLVTTLTKKMAEQLTEYLVEIGVKAVYLHSDVKTLERVEIIRDLRKGIYDVLVGVNLLREGLDIPECCLVAILDADKEGFLRSETSLIQTIGRAARNVEGRVILYANKETESIKKAISETNRRRAIQNTYNEEHGIIPTSIKKSLRDIIASVYEQDHLTIETEGELESPQMIRGQIDKLRRQMLKHATALEFEEAAGIRDKIHQLNQLLLKLEGEE